MSSQHAISCHILISVFQSWGHYRTAIGFACKLLQDHPDVLITFVSAGGHTKLSKIETDNNFLHKDQSSKNNLRFVHLGGEGVSFMDLSVHVLQNFPSLCETLFSPGKSIQSLDGLSYINTRKPDIFICDMFWLDLCNIFRAIPDCSAPVLAWVSPGTAGCMRVLGPEVLRGLGDVSAQAKLLATENERTPSEIEIEIYGSNKGEVLHMFGEVDIYDYELFPQGHNVDPIFPSLVYVYKQAHRMIMDSDGVFFASNTVFEPEVHQAYKEWCTKRGKSCYVVGPFTLEHDQLETMKRRSMESGGLTAELENFMDKIYASQGAHSLLYWSFGTIYSPNPQALLRVLQVILEMKIPLVFAHDPTRHGEIPPDLRAALDASGIVYICEWIPQELVLYHKVTGWFLTHCGLGSISEAIVHACPLIAWPIHADQPYHAAFCTLKLDVAYEMCEVRIVDGLRPLYRGVRPTGTKEAIIEEAHTVLKNAFGEDGRRKRRNIEQLRDRMNLLWKEGGDSLKDMRRFIADILPK